MKRTLVLALVAFWCASLFAQPSLTSFSPASGAAGSTVTISGAGFSADPLANIVYFGAVRASVTAATASSLTVTVPKGASYAPLSVTTGGLTAYSTRPFVLTFAGGGSLSDRSFWASFVDTVAMGDNDIRGLAVGDLDGDGLPDLAVVNRVENMVSLYRNTSSGEEVSFEPKVDYPTGEHPYAVAFGDLDGDGRLDVVVANSDIHDNTVSIYKNISSGTGLSFAAPLVVDAGTQPTSLCITELDGDGRPDVVVGNIELSGQLSILRNTTSGGVLSFAPRLSLAISGDFTDVKAADMDGDGKFDLLFSCFVSNYVVVLRNAGSGPGNIAFAAPQALTAGSNPSSLCIGDLDGDGKPDMAVTNFFSNDVSLFKNTSLRGTISFAARSDIGGMEGASDATLSDIDGDGKVDLLVTNHNGSNAYSVSVLKNTSGWGSFSFAPRIDYTSIGLQKVLAADMNGDGRPDMTVSGSVFRASVYRNRIGSPDIDSFTPGTAGAGTTVTIKGTSFTGATAVSFGGVPAASFTVVNATTITAVVGEGATGDVTVTTPMGRSTMAGFIFAPLPVITSFAPAVATTGTTVTIYGANFGAATSVSFGGTPAASFTIVSPAVITAVVAAGTSGDVVVTFPTDEVTAPGFLFTTAPLITGFAPLAARVGATVTISGANFSPVAADNTVYFGAVKARVLTASTTSLTVAVPLGASYKPISVTTARQTAYARLPFTPLFSATGGFTAGTFAGKTEYPLGSPSYGVGVGDWNGDGRVDFAATGFESKTVSVFRNASGPAHMAFAPKADYPLGASAVGVGTGDLDGDGALDMVALNWSASLFRALPATDTILFAPKVSVDEGRYHLAIGDLDADGRPEMLTTGFGVFQVMANTTTAGGLSFGAPVKYSTGSGEQHEACLADLDADGKADIAVVSAGSARFSVLRNTTTSAGLSFATPVHYDTGNKPWSIAAGDLDRDGRLDLVVASKEYGTVSVYINNTANGVIAFKDPVELGVGAEPRSIAMGDLNGDGWVDMVVVNALSNTITVLENRMASGVVSFGHYDYRTSSFPQYAAIADFDGDEKPDIGVANYAAQSVSIFRNGVGEQALDVCVGATATMTATLAGQAYQWQVNSGSGFVNLSDNGTYTGSTTATLEVKAVSDAFSGYQYRCVVGGANSTVYTLMVRPIPPAPQVTAPGTVICNTGYVPLTSSYAAGNQWYKDGALLTNETAYVLAAWWAGSYTVTATEYGCTSAPSAPLVLTATNYVTPAISIASSGCGSSSMTFTASVANGGAAPTIQWYVNYGQVGTGSSYTLNSYVDDMEVYAQLTSNAACAYPRQVSSNTVTINCTTTAVSEIDGVEVFEVAPVPTRGRFTVKLKLNAPRRVALQVVDSRGRVVTERGAVTMSGTTTTPLDLGGQGAGLYFLRATIGQRTVVRKILVVRGEK